jgi:hypothetical protein
MKPEFGLDECRTLNIEHWCQVLIHFGADEREIIEVLDEDAVCKYLKFVQTHIQNINVIHLNRLRCN